MATEMLVQDTARWNIIPTATEMQRHTGSAMQGGKEYEPRRPGTPAHVPQSYNRPAPSRFGAVDRKRS